ncbi:MAG: hypothetical protein B6D59_02350 [Campylobacteraceae bacterium 4484_4]|nr:MAG: hypothetical protein B6D59_02350 [Campylobacteraceae bacterium 4484_4]
MIKALFGLLFSMELMIILTIIFAIGTAVATFIENDYGTETAWAVVYGTHWLEVIMVLLGINLAGNIFRYKLYKRDKWPSLLFHAGFLVILLGAAMTRYAGFEGIMHIREGETQNLITSSDTYIMAEALKGDKKVSASRKIRLSKISSNNFALTLQLEEGPVVVRYRDYLPVAQKKVVPDPAGKPMINMMILKGSGEPTIITLKDKELYDAGEMVIALNQKPQNLSKPAILITTTPEGNFTFTSPKKLEWLKMADKSSGSYEADRPYPFESGRLYSIGNLKFVPRELYAKAKIKIVEGAPQAGGRRMNTASYAALIVDVSYKGEHKEVPLLGYGKGSVGIPNSVKLDGATIKLSWGAKLIPLPFALKLEDFILNRYPGSGSPSSYESKVVLIDKENNVEMPFRIYMNHVLDYRHYRFFQSSYDMDEKGTVLSVNNDPGKLPTYIGYLMLALGFIWTILNPKSRFRKLARAVIKDAKLQGATVLLLLGTLFSQTPLQASLTQPDPIDIAKNIDKEHAVKFGDLLMQNVNGRIQAVYTFSNDIMLKLAKKSSLYGLSPDQIVLGMIIAPGAWQDIPIIKVTHTRLKKILGLDKKEKYAAFNDFFEKGKPGGYKLAKYADTAMHKRPIERNEFDRRVIKADEKLNIVYMIYTGDLLKIVPKMGDPLKKWYSVKEAIETFPPEESQKVRSLFVNYFAAVDEARAKGDWQRADQALQAIKQYQYDISADIIPPKSKLQAEKLFKRLGITNKLILVYLFAGFFLLLVIMARMVKPHLKVKKVMHFTEWIIILAFIAHTIVLALRWYIGGHAPWSNAYEAMLYVAWAMAFSGVVFMRFSPLVPALTAIIAGITLGATFLSEMDPQITNLVPVLKSYWLNIHVSVITASYGFLGLSMILGFFTLILFILRNPAKYPNIDHSIIEATRINEMTAILGLMMLTLGNFLGGVWANESWGRYWGWDPKETWAWISILVYVIVVHLRFVPSFKKNYPFNFAVASTLAYSSIIMTFVGVNYYLSGMHSYAAGDPVPIPAYLYYIIAGVALTIALAWRKRDLCHQP